MIYLATLLASMVKLKLKVKVKLLLWTLFMHMPGKV